MGRRNKSRSKLPSRQKYEKNNPTVSARISIQNRDKLRLVLRKQGTTLPKVLIAFANEQEIKLKSIEDAKKASYELGFRDAKVSFAVSFPCPKCGHTIFVNGPEQIAQIRELIIKARLAHPECPIPYLPKLTAPKPTVPNMSRPNPNPPVVPVAKSNGNRDKILNFLQEQPGMQQMLKSDSNKKSQNKN